MARNKYPEETIQKIIETAAGLFMENGYDNTSIQDIIDNLGGLSKGAIYHHFRSKEDILNAVINHMYSGMETRILQVINRPDLNGLEKLRALLEVSIVNTTQSQVFALSVDMMKNPQILAAQISSTLEENSLLVLPIVLEGIADGSLGQLQYPHEFTEAFMLLSNIWLNPMVCHVTPAELEQKCRFMQHLVKSLGIEGDLISENIVQHLKSCSELFDKKHTK